LSIPRGRGRILRGVRDAGAAEASPVCVEDFVETPQGWAADAIIFSDDGGEVGDADDFAADVASSEEGIGVNVCGIGLKPAKPIRAKVPLVEGRLLAIEAIELPDKPGKLPMAVILEQVPVQALLMVPLVELSKLTAHEEQFFSWVSPHPSIEGAEVGELLPQVTGHTGDEGAFAVDDFVMGEGEDEVFGEGIEEAESQLIVVEAPVYWVSLEEFEVVMHPPHIPLMRKPKSSDRGWPADLWPGGGLFGHDEGAGVAGLNGFVEVSQEVNGFEVFAAAIGVGHPLAGVAAIVQIEHGGDGVDAKPVNVEFLNPIECAGEQEIADFMAAIVENGRTPVRVQAAPGVCMLIEGGAVEIGEGELVPGEMCGDPVDNDADAVLVQGVDEEAKIIRASKARSGSEIAADLVAPASAEGVLSDRHQLHMRKPEAFDIVSQSMRGFPAVEGAVVLFGNFAPRGQVDFINREGFVGAQLLRQAATPRVVSPDIVALVDDGGGFRGDFKLEGEGVRLGMRGSAWQLKLEFIFGTGCYFGNKQLPNSRSAHASHGVEAGVPVVEVPYNGDAFCIGCPDREGHTTGAEKVMEEVGPHFFPELLVGAFSEEVQIHLSPEGEEAIGVLNDKLLPSVGMDFEAVVQGGRIFGKATFKKAMCDGLHGQMLRVNKQLNSSSIRTPGTNPNPRRLNMTA